MLMINFVTFMRVLVFFCETQVRLAQILRTILMLRMQEMAFPGFKFQKFSGGGCPRTPLLGVAYGHACGLRPQCYGRILWLDPPCTGWSSFVKEISFGHDKFFAIIDPSCTPMLLRCLSDFVYQ